MRPFILPSLTILSGSVNPLRPPVALFSSVGGPSAGQSSSVPSMTRVKDGLYRFEEAQQLGQLKVGSVLPNTTDLVYLERFPYLYTVSATSGDPEESKEELEEQLAEIVGVGDIVVIKEQLFTGDGIIDVCFPTGKGQSCLVGSRLFDKIIEGVESHGNVAVFEVGDEGGKMGYVEGMRMIRKAQDYSREANEDVAVFWKAASDVLEEVWSESEDMIEGYGINEGGEGSSGEKRGFLGTVVGSAAKFRAGGSLTLFLGVQEQSQTEGVWTKDDFRGRDDKVIERINLMDKVSQLGRGLFACCCCCCCFCFCCSSTLFLLVLV